MERENDEPDSVYRPGVGLGHFAVHPGAGTRNSRGHERHCRVACTTDRDRIPGDFPGPMEKSLRTPGSGPRMAARIVYDTRSDAAGEVFGGRRIEAVNVETQEVRTVYESQRGAHCGVVTFHPTRWQVVFIHGPENPTPDWSYGPFHRQGVLVDWDRPGVAVPLDARDLNEPFTPGALRGGSHVHVFNGDGRFVSFTYEDHVLSQPQAEPGADFNQRNIGVSVVGRPVTVKSGHPRNHDGSAFTVLVTKTVNRPKPGTDEIQKAFEEGWVGTNGYVRADGTRQLALAFQGHVLTSGGATNAEVFLVDLPPDLTRAGDGPLAGGSRLRPQPPAGTVQRRLTHTADRRFPGIQGPRHWLRVSPDGERIGFLMKDDNGVVQIWSVSPRGGDPVPLTRNSHPVTSSFTWSPDGSLLAYVMDRSVWVTEVGSGRTRRLTAACSEADAPRTEACVFSRRDAESRLCEILPARTGSGPIRFAWCPGSFGPPGGG